MSKPVEDFNKNLRNRGKISTDLKSMLLRIGGLQLLFCMGHSGGNGDDDRKGSQVGTGLQEGQGDFVLPGGWSPLAGGI